MGTHTANIDQAVAGLMAVESRIIELANANGTSGGLRFEWNDGLDFGHLEDPVPLNIFAPQGVMAEAEFSHEDLAGYREGANAQVDSEINRLVQGIAREA